MMSAQTFDEDRAEEALAMVHRDWQGLPDRPRRLLAYMAVASGPGLRYDGGRDALVAALGLPEGTASSYRMVSAALRHLVDVGAIERGRLGRGVYRSEYLLTLSCDGPRVT